METQNIIYFDFINDFLCDGQYCNSSCCQNWGIEIDKAALHRYHNIKDKKIKREVEKNLFYHHEQKKHFFLLNQEGKCSFLGEDCLCWIQKNLGEEYLSDICDSYPRKYIKFPFYLTKTLSLSCPVVSRMLLEQTQSLALVEKWGMVKRKQIIEEKNGFNKYLLEKWLDIQCAGIRILQNGNLTIRERLLNLCMFCDALQELIYKDEELLELDSFLLAVLQDEQQREWARLGNGLPFLTQVFIKDLFSILNEFLNKKEKLLITSQDRKYIDMLEDYFQLKEENLVTKLVGLYEEAEILYRKHLLERYPLLQENYLVYQWFRTVQPIMADGNILQSITMYLLFYRLQEMMLLILTARERDDLQEWQVVECLSYVTQILEHQHMYFSVCADYIREKKHSLLEVMKIWLPRV